MKFYFLMVLFVFVSACAGPIYYDIKNNRSHWAPGNGGRLKQLKDTPVSISSYGCCANEDVRFWQVNDAARFGYANKIYTPTGNIKIIAAVKNKQFRDMVSIPTHFIAFNIDVAFSLDLSLFGDLKQGYRLASEEKGIEFEGRVFEVGDLYDAYGYLSLGRTDEDKKYIPAADTKVISSMNDKPVPIFGIDPTVDFHSTGTVKLTHDLDKEGRPVNIRAPDNLTHNSKLAIFTLKTMRFQKTLIGGSYVKRQNLIYTFNYTVNYWLY